MEMSLPCGPRLDVVSHSYHDSDVSSNSVPLQPSIPPLVAPRPLGSELHQRFNGLAVAGVDAAHLRDTVWDPDPPPFAKMAVCL